MKCRVLDVLAGMAILLWLLAGAMMVRSLGRSDLLVWNSPVRKTVEGTSIRGLHAISDGGAVMIRSESMTWFGAAGVAFAYPPGISFNSRDSGSPEIRGFWADRYVDHQARYINRVRLVRVPWWFIVLGLSITTLLTLAHFRRRYRAHRAGRIGLCPICGYDLRATPDRCPECGKVPEAAKGAAA